MQDSAFTPAEQPSRTDLTIHAGTCLPTIYVADLRIGLHPAFISVSLQWGKQEVSVYIDPATIAANAARFRDLADQLDALVAGEFVPASVGDLCAKPAAPEGIEHGV